MADGSTLISKRCITIIGDPHIRITWRLLFRNRNDAEILLILTSAELMKCLQMYFPDEGMHSKVFFLRFQQTCSPWKEGMGF